MSTSGTDPAPEPAPLDAGAVVGALADADRRSAFAAVQLGASTLDHVVAAAGLPTASAAKALGKLAEVGLLVQHAAGLAVAADALQGAARALRAKPVSAEHADEPAEVRKVLDVFVVDGRITQIPVAHQKRQVVLDWLVQRFEPGRRYSEQMVNLLIGQAHADTAALRRYLVDNEFLDRADGMYWRSGGTVTPGDPTAWPGGRAAAAYTAAVELPPPPSRPLASSRSGMAVAALVCGIVGLPLFFLVVPSILGIVFGFVAASAIRASGGRLSGAGMARAGWIVGIAGVLGFGVMVWATATGRIDNDGDEATKPAGSLTVGECVEELPTGAFTFEFTAVDCAMPHAAEVFAVAQLNEAGDVPYPGDSEAERLASEACLDRFEAYVGRSYQESVFEVYFIYSKEIRWKATRGTVECLVYDPGRPDVGSVRGSDR